MYYYDQDDILKILKTVRDAGLIAPDGMLSAGVAELQKPATESARIGWTQRAAKSLLDF